MSKHLDLHGKKSAFVKTGYSFLVHLCMPSSAGESVKDTHIIKAILQTLEYHTSEPRIMIKGLRALETMAFCENVEIRNHMKEQGVIPACEKIMSERDDIKEACQAVIDAVNRKDLKLDSLKVMTTKVVQTDKSASHLFAEKKEKTPVLDHKAKNFLTAGMLLIVHTEMDKRRCHVHVSIDLKWFVWKDVKKSKIDDSMRMRTIHLRSVEKGRCSKELKKQTLMGKPIIKA